MAHVVKNLVATGHFNHLSVYVSNEGTIYRDQVVKLARETDDERKSRFERLISGKADVVESSKEADEEGTVEGEGWHPVLIILPLRLGLDKFNRMYKPCLLRVFTWPQCMGMMGGRPAMSFYFIGSQLTITRTLALISAIGLS